MIKALTLFFLFFFSQASFGSSCCAGGSSAATIILDDNDHQWSFGVSARNDFGHTDSLGYSNKNKNEIKDEQYAFNLSYSQMISERVQLAAKTSFIQKSIQKYDRQENQSGLSDVELQSTFEFLPEYTYSLLKPRGFLFAKLSLPTSPSIHDSTSPLFADVRGLGLLSMSAGTLFSKRINQLHFLFGAEFKRVFGKQIGTSRLEDSHRLLIPFSGSMSIESWGTTLGVSNSWNYQSAKEITGTLKSQSQAEYFWDTGFFANHALNRELSIGLSYNNSALMGKNINSSMYQSIALNLISSKSL